MIAFAIVAAKNPLVFDSKTLLLHHSNDSIDDHSLMVTPRGGCLRCP